MKAIFTICSNNYLAQAIVLGQSVRTHHPEATFFIVLVDERSPEIDYATIPFEIIPMSSIEPRTAELAAKYDIIELNTCVKARAFEHLFTERGFDRAFYLDPDIRVYAPLVEVDAALAHANAVLTPHILTPIPDDGKTPDDLAFLRFGVYNLGFLGLAKSSESLALVRWWKERLYEHGYIRLEAGMFTDQIWANYMPIFFRDVTVLKDPGYNMAPWNLHERVLEKRDGAFWVNGTHRLAFFHLSSFRVDTGELPLHGYNRFAMKARPDLVELWAQYNDELKAAGYARFRKIRWAYHPAVTPPGPLDGLKKSVRRAVGHGVLWGVRKLPSAARERAYLIFRDTRG